MKDRAGVVALAPGRWLEHDGGQWRVVALDGTAVLVQDGRGRERQMLVDYLLTHPSTRPIVDDKNVLAETGSVALALDVESAELAQLDERVGHLREVLTGFKSGHAETALAGEPRPPYQPGQPSLTRYAAKAAELGVTQRTVQRWVADYKAGGAIALLDGRRERRSSGLDSIDQRWVEICREVLAEHTDASTPTKAIVLERVHARLVDQFGDGVVVEPGRTRAYEALSELSRGRNSFRGSAKGRRSIAGRPQGTYGRLRATRPGEYLLLDTTPLDVFAMEPVTLRWVQCELTVAFDLMSRCVAGLRLTPTTKAVDAVGAIYDAICAKQCDPAWGPQARWPYLGVPTALVVDADKLVEGSGLAGMPVVAPETVVVDHGKMYVSHHVQAVCDRLGISIQPARPYMGTDKAALERFFRTLRESLLVALPGYKGPDVYSRGVDVESRAFYFLDELERIIREWVAAVYHRRPHEGLCIPEAPGVDMSPNDMYCWGVQRAGFVHIAARPDLLFDFLPVAWRQINHYGVEVGGLRYNGPALDPYRQATSPYSGQHQGKWPLRIDTTDRSHLWFQDPDTHDWHRLDWEHADALDGPFSQDALDHAKKLAATGDRFGDVRLVLRDMLERWDAGLARNPTERRIMLRTSQERAGLLGPSPAQPQPGEPDPEESLELQQLASVRALYPDGVPPPAEPPVDLDGDDDDAEDLEDVSDDDFYAGAFEVLD